MGLTARLTAAAAIVLLLVALPARGEWPPEKTTNLQTLPKDTEIRELVGIMRGFATSLGVECGHCHVGDDPGDLATLDFASDDKETKRTARTMLRMVEAINGQHLSDLGGEAPRIEVGCRTCHRGLARPELITDLVARVTDDDGAEAAAARYRELRTEHYGDGAFDFTVWPLLELAERWGRGETLDKAIAMAELAIEFHPEEATAHHYLAEIELRSGDRAAAIAGFERSLELDPQNSRAAQRLEELRTSDTD